MRRYAGQATWRVAMAPEIWCEPAILMAPETWCEPAILMAQETWWCEPAILMSAGLATWTWWHEEA